MYCENSGRRARRFAKQTAREPRIRNLYFIEGAAFCRVYGYDRIEKAAAYAEEGQGGLPAEPLHEADALLKRTRRLSTSQQYFPPRQTPPKLCSAISHCAHELLAASRLAPSGGFAALPTRVCRRQTRGVRAAQKSAPHYGI